MKLTNGDIFGSQEPLRKLVEQKFPVMVSYKLSKLVMKLNEQFKVIEEVRNGLIKKYGETDEKGQIMVKPELEKKDDRGEVVIEPNPVFPKFVGEFNELMAQEVEVVIEKVKLPEKVASTCDKCNHNMDRLFEIEPTILMALDKFVEV